MVYWRNEPTLIFDFSDDGRLKTFRVIYQQHQQLICQMLAGHVVRPIREPVGTVHHSTNPTCRATLIKLTQIGQDAVLDQFSRVFGLARLTTNEIDTLE